MSDQGSLDFEKLAEEDRELIEKSPWKEERRCKVNRKGADGKEWYAVVSAFSKKGDSVPYLLAEVMIQANLEELSDLLDIRLLERQTQWHELFIDGNVEQVDENLQRCYMQYRSGSSLVNDRDCYYYKYRKRFEGGFLLSYRDVQEQDNRPIPKGFQRVLFSGAHLLETVDEKTVRYRYYQHANPGGWVPHMFLKSAQGKILLSECKGVQRAVDLGRFILKK